MEPKSIRTTEGGAAALLVNPLEYEFINVPFVIFSNAGAVSRSTGCVELDLYNSTAVANQHRFSLVNSRYISN